MVEFAAARANTTEVVTQAGDAELAPSAYDRGYYFVVHGAVVERVRVADDADSDVGGHDFWGLPNILHGRANGVIEFETDRASCVEFLLVKALVKPSARDELAVAADVDDLASV